METGKIPLLGDPLPQMKVLTTHGPKTIPDDYKGKWLVLFSHPGDFTPVCTTEFYAFAKRNDDFKNLNAELLGLSVDQVFAHIKWVEWIKENLLVSTAKCFDIIDIITDKLYSIKVGIIKYDFSGGNFQ